MSYCCYIKSLQGLQHAYLLTRILHNPPLPNVLIVPSHRHPPTDYPLKYPLLTQNGFRSSKYTQQPIFFVISSHICFIFVRSFIGKESEVKLLEWPGSTKLG